VGDKTRYLRRPSPALQRHANQAGAASPLRLVENLVPVMLVAPLHDDEPLIQFASFELVASRPFLVPPDHGHGLQILRLYRVQELYRRLTGSHGARQRHSGPGSAAARNRRTGEQEPLPHRRLQRRIVWHRPHA